MFKDWEFEHFMFAGLIFFAVCVLSAGAWCSIIDYNKDLEMAKLGYVEVIQTVHTTQCGDGYEKVWVPRGTLVEKK